MRHQACGACTHIIDPGVRGSAKFRKREMKTLRCSNSLPSMDSKDEVTVPLHTRIQETNSRSVKSRRLEKSLPAKYLVMSPFSLKAGRKLLPNNVFAQNVYAAIIMLPEMSETRSSPLFLPSPMVPARCGLRGPVGTVLRSLHPRGHGPPGPAGSRGYLALLLIWGNFSSKAGRQLRQVPPDNTLVLLINRRACSNDFGTRAAYSN